MPLLRVFTRPISAQKPDKRLKQVGVAAGGAEAAFAPGGFIKVVDLFPSSLCDGCEHELRHPVAALDGKIVIAMVDEDDFQLTAIVGILYPLEGEFLRFERHGRFTPFFERFHRRQALTGNLSAQ